MSVTHSKKTALFLVLITILLLGITSWLIIQKIESEVRMQLGVSLMTAVKTYQQGIKSWSDEHASNAMIWANTPELRKATGELLAKNRNREALITSPAQARLRAWLSPLCKAMGYPDYFILGPDAINISASRNQYIGARNLLYEEDTFLTRILAGEIVVSAPNISDVPLYDSDGKLRKSIPVMYVGAPIEEDDGRVRAVLLFRLNPKKDFTAILQQGRIGESSESYAFDQQARFISNTRLSGELHGLGLNTEEEAGMQNASLRSLDLDLTRGSRTTVHGAYQQMTRMAQTIISGESAIDIYEYRDDRGVKVVSAWFWDSDMGLGLATKLDEIEVYEGLRSTQYFILLITFLSMALLLGLQVIFHVSHDRKQAKNNLLSSQSELQLLSKRLIIAQEIERKRIAAELHDGIGQSLSAIIIGIENVHKGMKENISKIVKNTLEGIIDKLHDAIEEVRRISMDLRPSILDDLGLLPTINWFCREYTSLFPMIVLNKRIDIEEGEISECKKIVIFRIIQETLNNIAKHANAQSISIELARRGDLLYLRIEDDGLGFEERSISKAVGLGLSNMKERARLSGGKITINSTPKVGTVIEAVWPLSDIGFNYAEYSAK